MGKQFFFLDSDVSLKFFFQLIYSAPSLKAINILKKYYCHLSTPTLKNSKQNSIISYYTSGICKNYMMFDRTFKCTDTVKVYYNKGEMKSKSTNLIYLIICMKCWEKYIDSAIKFKNRFRIHRSYIKSNKDHCGTERYFNNKCWDSLNPSVYLRVQLIEGVCDDCNIEDILWDKKYWQSQSFINVTGMNSTSDLYSVKRKYCRKH